MVDLKALNEAVDQSGYKKSAIAERLNVSMQTLARKLDGETELTVSEAQGFADILGFNGSQLQRIFFARK